jgi:aminopeptidase
MQRSLSSNTTHEAALPDGFVSAAIDPVSFISNRIAITMTHHSICATIPDAAIDIAERNLRDILTLAIEHLPARSAIVVWDAQCDLAIALTEAYRRCLPNATFIDFDSIAPETVRAEFERLAPADLVVLIQSTSFRLDAFRIRVELFKRFLKVIEHPHLSRMPGAEALIYIDSLAYDPAYFRGVGNALKVRIDGAQECVIDSDGEQLVFTSGLESAKLNVGDYSNMQNIGGQFPIGEVFTESKDLEAVNGRVRISIFGDTAFTVNKPVHPITLVVSNGRVTEVIDSTPEFDRVLANIRADEGEIWLRELGLGLNKEFTQDRIVSDIGTFERMCGVHLSLGAKHGSYNKPNIKKTTAKHHVDVFAITKSVTLDNEVIYRDGAWQVDSHTTQLVN